MKITSIQLGNGYSLSGVKNSFKVQEQNQPSNLQKTNLTSLPNTYTHNINFKSAFIQGESEIYIENVLNLRESQNMNSDKKTNPDGLYANVTKLPNNNMAYQIANSNGEILGIEVSENAKNLPVVRYSQGKFKPEATISHPTLGKSRIKLFAGSELTSAREDGSLNWKIRMPGKIELPKNSTQVIRPTMGDISFGKKRTSYVGLTTLNLEPRTQNAIDIYMNANLDKKVMPGKYQKLVKRQAPTLIIPAGGFGERLYNLTNGKENKPSAHMPTDHNHRIIGTTLDLAASAGLLYDKKQIHYLSQAGQIKGKNISKVNKYKTDGGAISEGLKKGLIPNNKDMIILNADIFTNADISRVYHALHALPDAALVIPYYIVDAERAKSFGLMGVKQTDKNIFEIKNFIEKPPIVQEDDLPQLYYDLKFNAKTMSQQDAEALIKQHGSVIDDIVKFEQSKSARHHGSNNEFYANPGIYALSKEAVHVLKNVTRGSEAALRETGLGAHVIPKIVKLCNEGKLKTTDGRPMKVYTVPLEAVNGKPAFWDDIGTAEAYLKVIRDVAYETKKHRGAPFESRFFGIPPYILDHFVENTDSAGMVYLSDIARKDFENFQIKNKVTANGNIFIVDN